MYIHVYVRICNTLCVDVLLRGYSEDMGNPLESLKSGPLALHSICLPCMLASQHGVRVADLSL